MGLVELVLILLLVLLFFGAGKLPGLGAGLGKAIRGFKQAVSPDRPPQRSEQAPPQPPRELPPGGPKA